MNLAELKRNRRLYRLKEGQVVTEAGDQLSYASNNALTPQQLLQIQQLPATAVAPGTQIFSAVWSTSTSPNRITLTPNDRLTVYENGLIQMLLSSNGLTFGKTGVRFYDNASNVQIANSNALFAQIGLGVTETDAGNAVQEGIYFNDDVNGLLRLNGVRLANYYRGYIDQNGNKLLGTPGYTVTHPSTGVYVITFTNPALATTNAGFSAVATATSGHYRCRVDFPALNQIRFSWQQSTYSSGLYTGESPVNTDFNFIASRATI